MSLSTAPASVTNTASVSGGGETNSANDTANDVTTITVPDTQPPSAPGLLTAVAPNGTHVDAVMGTGDRQRRRDRLSRRTM